MAATDSAPLLQVLGLNIPPSEIAINRESKVDTSNRPDIVLSYKGERVAVVEVKVLAGIGPRQLSRYATTVPDSAKLAIIYPGKLPLTAEKRWEGLTWEAVLQAFSHSRHGWVRTTASAWLEHLFSTLPSVHSKTIWNCVPDDQNFALAMRTRLSWLWLL